MADEEKQETTTPEKEQQGAAQSADAALLSLEEAPRAAPKVHAKNIRHVSFAVAHIRATFNNTMIAISDTRGNVLGWSSAGRAGFKGSRKSTAYAGGVVGQEVARQAVAVGVKEVEVRVQGPGAGRETAIRALQSAGLNINVIKDVTPIPHNGCRPRKRRRV